jgi:hypothetical protein
LACLAGLAVFATARLTAPATAQVAPRDQSSPDLVYMSESDQYLLVWSEDRGAGHRIYARRVHANGAPVGLPNSGEWEAIRLDTDAYPGGTADMLDPAVIPGLLVYSFKAPGGSDYNIMGQRLFENGRPNGWPMLIQGGPGDQRYPDVVAVERGLGVEYLVVWSEDTRDQGDVMGLRVDYALRRSRGPAYPIVQAPGTAEDPTVKADPVNEDQFLVLYTDDRNGNRDIFGTRLSANGLPRGGATGGQFEVVTSPEDDYGADLLEASDTTGPREQPRQIVVWTRDHVTEGPNVMGLRLEQTGLPKGSPFKVAAGNGAQAWPAGAVRHLIVSPDRGGRPEQDEFLVVWTEDALGNLDIHGLRLGLFGQLRSRAKVLASD